MCKFVPKTVYVNVYKHKIILVSAFKIWYGFKIDILIYTMLVIITIKFYGHIFTKRNRFYRVGEFAVTSLHIIYHIVHMHIK